VGRPGEATVPTGAALTTPAGSVRGFRTTAVTSWPAARARSSRWRPIPPVAAKMVSFMDLKEVDLGCLDTIARHGPLSPSALAGSAGLHPATVTGILDRLERGGWVARERDPSDRRAVVVRALRDRNAEVFRLYSGMNASLDQILAGYSGDELELLAGFLRRATDAGRAATDDLASR
jgi:DNA-binding MarR family transcriptional regulator